MRNRLVKRSLTFAGLHILAFVAAFALASPMLNVASEPSRIAVASCCVMLALSQPMLSISRALRIGEFPMILANSLLWGLALALTLQVVAPLVRRAHRA